MSLQKPENSVDADVLLDVVNVTMRFGGVTAVDDVSFRAMARRITAIIGPNGAGKTTLFNCLTGFYRPTLGRLTLRHNSKAFDIAHLPAHKISQFGVARTFQNIRLFANMTALENLMVAQHAPLMRASCYSFGAIIGMASYRKAEAAAIERARFWLDQMSLLKAADRLAGELPYGMQRRLEIARSMCTGKEDKGPALLCLDEPAAGLNTAESLRLREAIRKIRDEHKTGVLLIEHNMNVVMEISDHVVVLDYGKRIAEGAPQSVRTNPAVIAAYLGEEEDGTSC